MQLVQTFATLSLAASAAAQYHHHRHKLPSHHHYANVFARQAGVEGQTVTITDNSRTEATTIPEIVVFVDGASNPVSSATAVVALVPPTQSALLQDVVKRSLAFLPCGDNIDDMAESGVPAAKECLQPVSTLAELRSRKAVVKASRSVEAVGTSQSSLNARAASSGLFGVAYAPYNADGSCKSASQIMADFGVIGKTYGMVRVYGVDCNQIPAVYAAANANDLRVMYGIFSLDNLGDQIATLAAGIQSDWSRVDTVSVGNELVNNGQASPQQIQDALTAARQALTSAGWTGPVVTVDTFVAALAHPELCSSSDYCAVNIHPFFDPNTPAEKAGQFVLNMVQALRQKLGNPTARVRVTESGWPWQGSANGQAVPGVDQQAAAISSIRSAFADNPDDMVLFSAFNDRWKIAAADTFYAEQFWGMGTADAPSA